MDFYPDEGYGSALSKGLDISQDNNPAAPNVCKRILILIFLIPSVNLIDLSLC
jgi:hypothetical protein